MLLPLPLGAPLPLIVDSVAIEPPGVETPGADPPGAVGVVEFVPQLAKTTTTERAHFTPGRSGLLFVTWCAVRCYLWCRG